RFCCRETGVSPVCPHRPSPHYHPPWLLDRRSRECYAYRANFPEDLMRIRKVFLTALMIALVSGILSKPVIAQTGWAVEKTFHVGGVGGWDYVTLDAKNHRLYVPRSTHTMVLDAETGATLADIAGQKQNHGVALVPEAGRGFISDGSGSVVIF